MSNEVIEKLAIHRAALIEIIVVAFLFGVCASISGAIVYRTFEGQAFWLYSFLIALFSGCILFLYRKFAAAGSASVDVSGFILYLKNKNDLQEVPRYQFSEEIFRYLGGAFSENKALRKQWDKEPLSQIFSREQGATPAASMKLVCEAVEYYVLETLSNHLKDYFNIEEHDDSELKEFSREDVPTILLNNRFMELFSAPMENRSAFSDDYDIGGGEGVIVMSMGSNGEFYSRFDLVLPKGAVVTRENGNIVIETSKFKLTLSIKFDGTGYVAPRGFEKYYLGLESFRDYTEFKVRFRADVRFKLLSSFRKAKWDYHSWLDGFFETIEGEMSGEKFFQKINWETVSTMIQCGQKMPNKQNQPDA